MLYEDDGTTGMGSTCLGEPHFSLTAFTNLSSPKTNPSLLQRTEIVAFFNTLNRFSESIRAIGRFREMYQEKVKSAEREKEKAEKLMKLRMQAQAGKKEKKEDQVSCAINYRVRAQYMQHIDNIDNESINI